MSRVTFDRELGALQDRLLALGSQVEHNIVESVEILMDRDQIAAQKLIAADQDINRERIAIMNDAHVLIATQQPMAGDMRLIASIIEITGELERINDYAKGIAKNSLMLPVEPIPVPMSAWPVMAGKTGDMLHRALGAAGQRDADLARAIPADDDQIDDLFNQIYRQLITYVADNPASFELVNYLEWALHNLERAADRVTNICEWVVYNVTGEYLEMDSEFEAPPGSEGR
jgi:phosphate transport system protein